MVLFLFFAIVALGMYLAINPVGEGYVSSAPVEGKTHKWVLKFEADRRGYLICKRCGRQPGGENDYCIDGE